MIEKNSGDQPAAVATGAGQQVTHATPADATIKDAAPTDVQAYIGRQLRAVYDDIAKQPIPDRFLALMRQLEAKGAS